jgi:hypothetical protein
MFIRIQCSQSSVWPFLYGIVSKDGIPIRLSMAFLTLCAILRVVVLSVAEAKLGALFLNCKEEMIFCLTFKKFGHLQPKTHIHCKNAMAVCIANNNVKCQCSCSMETRCFWVCDKVSQDACNINWHPGQESLADY